MKRKIIASISILLCTFFLLGCNNNSIDSKKEVNETNITENNKNELDDEVIKEGDEITIEEPEVEYININSEDVRIPILMYHSISSEDPNNSLMVPPDMFDEQMAWLEENEFTAMNMDEAVEAMETGKVPKRPVVITFDDGYSDNYTQAFPSLKNHNLKATFFVITDGVDDGYYMSSDMLKEMQEAGMSIENHTANHLELNNLSRADAYDSIKRGQDFLREVIGSDGNFLCYPVGKYNDETIEICNELGIKAAVTTQGGITSIGDGKHKFKRVRISPMSIEGFASFFTEYL